MSQLLPCEACGKPSVISKRDVWHANMNTAGHDTGMLTRMLGDWHHWCWECYPGPKSMTVNGDGSVWYKIGESQ